MEGGEWGVWGGVRPRNLGTHSELCEESGYFGIVPAHHDDNIDDANDAI